MRCTVVAFALLLSTPALFAQADTPNPTHGIVVPHWARTGNNTNGVYAVSADTSTVHGGKSSVSIRCDTCSTARVPEDAPETAYPFASTVQEIRTDDFKGKRVTFAAYMKTTEVQGDGAGLWLRVDGPGLASLAFDNMSEPDRLVRGTTDWKQYRIVLDVPQDAQVIAFGAMLTGKGQVWVDDASLETTDPKTPETADQKKMKEDSEKELAQITPEQRAQFDKQLQQSRERAKTYPTQLQNPGFEQ